MNLVPNRVPTGQTHILCEQSKYTILSTGQVITRGQWGLPFDGNALAHALRFHGFPGVVVRARGNHHRGLSLNNPNGNLVETVKWTTGNVGNITIIGDEPDLGTRIGSIGCFNNTGDVRIEKLTLMNPGTSTCPFIVGQNTIVGRMLLYDLQFLPMDPHAWQGKGMKWNIRGNGVARKWDCRNLKFHKAVEHGAYTDNHLEDSYFVKCVGSDMGRTLLQLANRAQSGPASQGVLVVSQCVSNNGGTGGDGGSDFTIVGNGEGTIYFLNNKSFGSRQGSLVHWTDQGHGVYLTQNGFSSSSLIINDFEVNCPNADRDHVSISGVEDVIVSDWNITGNRTAIGLDSKFGGNIKNGSVALATNGKPPTQEPGWNTPKKMTKGIWSNGVWQSTHILSDQEIDALVSARG